MNVDYRQLELVAQFSSFLQLISEPEKILGLVDDAKKALAEEKEMLGPRATLAGAEAFKQAQEKQYMEELAKLREERIVEQERAKGLEQDLSNRIVEVQATHTNLTNKLASLDGIEKAIQDRLAAVEKQELVVAERERTVAAWADSLALQEVELQKKQEQLKSILGN